MRTKAQRAALAKAAAASVKNIRSSAVLTSEPEAPQKHWRIGSPVWMPYVDKIPGTVIGIDAVRGVTVHYDDGLIAIAQPDDLEAYECQ